MFVVNLRDHILTDCWKNRKTCKTFMPHGITFKLGNYGALSSCVNKFCKLILIKT